MEQEEKVLKSKGSQAVGAGAVVWLRESKVNVHVQSGLDWAGPRDVKVKG
jgi:hypothetical protein